MKKFRGSTIAAASLSALAFTFGGLGSSSAWAGHGSSGGSHGGHGSHGGGLFHHGGHGSSGGSHGGHGSHGGGHKSHGGHGSHGGGLFHHGGHGSSGGSWGGYGSNGGAYGEPYGSPQGGYASPQGGAASPQAASPQAASPQAAYLNVTVPEDAKVYLQDQLMTLNGAQRRFVTPDLSDGRQHVYTVKVEVERNGQTVSKTTQATVAAGQEVQVAVAFDAQNPQDLVASVTPSTGR